MVSYCSAAALATILGLSAASDAGPRVKWNTESRRRSLGSSKGGVQWTGVPGSIVPTANANKVRWDVGAFDTADVEGSDEAVGRNLNGIRWIGADGLERIKRCADPPNPCDPNEMITIIISGTPYVSS